MDSMTRNFNTNENFWETNPSFRTIKLFDQFAVKDKSKGKAESSKIMWAIAFLIDPHEHNVWRNLTETDKKILIVEDFLDKKDFEWEKYEPLIEEYYKRVLSIPEKDFYELIEKLHERKEFIKSTPYTLDSINDNGKLIKGTARDLDKMLIETSKLYAQLEDVKDKLERSKHVQGETKGGMQESASEQGLL